MKSPTSSVWFFALIVSSCESYFSPDALAQSDWFWQNPQADRSLSYSCLLYQRQYRGGKHQNSPTITDTGFTILGQWAWGACNSVASHGSHTFIGNGPTFHVLDVSNPDTALIIGEYLTNGIVQDIVVRDSLAFVVTGDSLLVVNIDNPADPSRVGAVEARASLQVALSDSIAFVTIFDGKMDIIDISNPSNPYRRNRAFAVGFLPWCLATSYRRAYIGSPSDPSMVIVDASNPDSLRRGLFHLDGWGISSYVEDTLLLVGSRLFSGGRYLRIFSIANPDTPVLLSQVNILSSNSEINGISAANNVAFLATIDSGIVSVDFSNPYQPNVRSRFKSPTLPVVDYNTGGVAVSQSSVYVSYTAGLLSLDISQSDSLDQRFFFPTGGAPGQVQIKDSLAFVASGPSGLWILDISDPRNPRGISNVMTGGYADDITITDSTVFIINGAKISEDTTRGLWVVDIRDVWYPIILSHHIGIIRFSPSYVHFNSIDKEGNFVYVSQTGGNLNDSIMEIIDVSNLSAPNTLGVFRARYSPYSIAVEDSFVYLATPDSGLRIVDVRSPFLPVEVGAFAQSQSVIGITLADQMAFAYRPDSIFVLNVSEPGSPVVIGGLQRNGQSGVTSADLTFEKDWLYWADGSIGIVDVSNPSQPIQRLTTEFDANGVAAKQEIFIVADGLSGVWILSNDFITSAGEHRYYSFPREIHLAQNYPNPFNLETVIRYSLPATGFVSLRVFNILGQEVTMLVNEKMGLGSHAVMWKATGLSSGIYFYRLQVNQSNDEQTGFSSETKKLILLK